MVDTNVFISACIGRGPASKVIEACIAGDVQPVMGEKLFLEYRDVLSRDPLYATARLNHGERASLLDVFASKCTWHIIHFNWRPNLQDEADNHILELAIAADAPIIVTANTRDFHGRELKFPHISVERPEHFLRRLDE